jgi:hypothetical protein
MMADIELVVKISEENYNIIKNYTAPMSWAEHVIKNGTPLPKGHGRLIDADELYGDFIDGTEGSSCQTWDGIEIGDVIEDAPTIIEADREVKR